MSLESNPDYRIRGSGVPSASGRYRDQPAHLRDGVVLRSAARPWRELSPWHRVPGSLAGSRDLPGLSLGGMPGHRNNQPAAGVGRLMLEPGLLQAALGSQRGSRQASLGYAAQGSTLIRWASSMPTRA